MQMEGMISFSYFAGVDLGTHMLNVKLSQSFSVGRLLLSEASCHRPTANRA